MYVICKYCERMWIALCGFVFVCFVHISYKSLHSIRDHFQLNCSISDHYTSFVLIMIHTVDTEAVLHGIVTCTFYILMRSHFEKRSCLVTFNIFSFVS